MVVDNVKMNKIKDEVSRAGSQMQDNREEKPFTELEKALGYSAFFTWLGVYLDMKNKGDERASEYFQECNHSARAIATSFMMTILGDDSFRIRLMEIVPDMNPAKEMVLAKATSTMGNSSFDPYWLHSTTRAVIMICRQLAYNFTGVLGQVDFRLANQGISFEELGAATDQWLNEVTSISTSNGRHGSPLDAFSSYAAQHFRSNLPIVTSIWLPIFIVIEIFDAVIRKGWSEQLIGEQIINLAKAGKKDEAFELIHEASERNVLHDYSTMRLVDLYSMWSQQKDRGGSIEIGIREAKRVRSLAADDLMSTYYSLLLEYLETR